MKKAIELYPTLIDDEYFFGTGDYQPIIESFGDIILQVDDSDYQGDSRVVLQKEGRYGLLIFGWGSCSGCDALQACNSFEEVDRLIVSLHNDIKWFDNLEDLKEYSAKKDWALEYSYYADETKKFINKITEL